MPFINTEVGLVRPGYGTVRVSNAAHPVIESLVGLCVSAADYVLVVYSSLGLDYCSMSLKVLFLKDYSFIVMIVLTIRKEPRYVAQS